MLTPPPVNLLPISFDSRSSNPPENIHFDIAVLTIDFMFICSSDSSSLTHIFFSISRSRPSKASSKGSSQGLCSGLIGGSKFAVAFFHTSK